MPDLAEAHRDGRILIFVASTSETLPPGTIPNGAA
jgi:hypothetical protein